MFKNYLKTAIRNLIKNKGYSVINIFGLAIGISVCVLIFLYVSFELSYDKYHNNIDRIFRVSQFEESVNHTSTSPITAPTLGPALKKDYPEVEVAARISNTGSRLVTVNEKKFYEEKLFAADNEIFDIITTEFIEGNPEFALSQPNSIVINKELKEKYFGNKSALGENLIIHNDNYKITGVIEDVPKNSHFQFKGLITMGMKKQPGPTGWWTWHCVYTYVKLKPNTYNESFEKKMSKVGDNYAKELFNEMGYSYTFLLQPISNLHLHPCAHSEPETPGNTTTLYIFSFIAFVILLIACINFINLNTARATKRAKEIGVRKVLGSRRIQLIRQYIGESLIMSLIAILLSFLIIDFSFPLLNNFSGLNFALYDLFKPQILLVFVVLIIFCGIISGIYPALFLSGFNPILTLKKQSANNSGSSIRKGIVIFQFFISVVLIISTIVANRQLNFMKNSDLGFDNKLKVVIPLNRDIDIHDNYEMVKEEFDKIPSITGASVCSKTPGEELILWNVKLLGTDNDKSQSIFYMHIGPDFLSELGINIISGKGLNSITSPDSLGLAYIINESALSAFGWSNPEEAIGKKLKDRHVGEIIGVVNNFYYKGLQHNIGPLIMNFKPYNLKRIILSINPEDINKTIIQIEKTYKELFEQNTFEYYFLKDNFNNQYNTEQKMGKIFSLFTGLGIFIACLGLLGLASFTAEQRTKEIGIRKVLGSSVNSVVFLLSKEFSKWVLIATIIAWPVAWFIMNKWLAGFVNKSELSWWIFIVSGGLALLIALLTVSYQALRVATKNPADSLRDE